MQVRTPAFKEWFGDWENGLAGRAFDAGRGRVGNAAGDDSGFTEGVQNIRGGGAVSDVVPDPDTREPRAVFHGTADDITAFDLNHANRKDAGIQGRGIQQGIHGNAGRDGYRPMVTSMVTGKTGPSGRSRGCALWCDLAALKRNADDGDQHPQPDPAHRRLFILVDALMVTLEPKRASWA